MKLLGAVGFYVGGTFIEKTHAGGGGEIFHGREGRFPGITLKLFIEINQKS